MAIYTSRVSYRGDIARIDITAKSSTGIGRYLKPTWKMVMDYKKNGDRESYKKLYYDILDNNWYYVKDLIHYSMDNDIVLMCYCKAGEFCHRVLLAEYISNLSDVQYLGEI